MSSYRQLLYHFVFRTKESKPVLERSHTEEFYSYITGIIRNKNSHLFRINGTEDHIHILSDVHPSISVSDFMKEIKASSSVWIKDRGLFKGFEGWAEGYGAFTCSYPDLGGLFEYIRNQQEHHKNKMFEEELRRLILESGLSIDERYFP